MSYPPSDLYQQPDGYAKSLSILKDLMECGAIRPSEPAPVVVRPLVHRCKCGRPISKNRLACKACAQAQVQETARGIAKYVRTDDELERFLQQFDPEEREQAAALIRPHMLARFEESEAADVSPSPGEVGSGPVEVPALPAEPCVGSSGEAQEPGMPALPQDDGGKATEKQAEPVESDESYEASAALLEGSCGE